MRTVIQPDSPGYPSPRRNGRAWMPATIVLTMIATVALAVAPQPASAAMVTIASFSGGTTNPASGHSLSASALFQWNDATNQLVITLTNTSTEDYESDGQMVPSDILTALFFDVTPEQGFTQATPFAVAGAGSQVLTGSTVSAPATGTTGGNVINVTAPSPTVGGWKYSYDTDNIPIAQNQGVGTAGLTIFNGSQVQDWNYGLVNAGYEYGDASNAFNSRSLIRSSVILTLNGLTSSKVTIRNVRFQYGTDLEEPFIVPGDNPGGGGSGNPVPEPASLALAGFAGIGLALGAFRRRRRA